MVWAALAEPHGVEACDHVGDAVSGTRDLVEELRGDRVNRDRASGSSALGDDAAAVAGDLGDRETGLSQVGDVAEEGEIASRDLCSALDGVTRDGGTGEGVEIVGVPAMPPRGGARDDRGIGDASGDYDVGARPQRRGDAVAAEVGIGRHNIRGVVAPDFAGVEMAENFTRAE